MNIKDGRRIRRSLQKALKTSLDLSETQIYQQLGNELRHQMLEDEQSGIFGQLFGSMPIASGYLAATTWYSAKKDEIKAYQKANNISSIYWSSVQWGDEIIRYPYADTQLETLPQDYRILAKHKSLTCQKFADFMRRGNYPLFEVSSDIDIAFIRPTGFDNLWDVCDNAIATWLSGDFAPSPVYDDNNNILYYQKEASILFNMDKDLYRGNIKHFSTQTIFSPY